jgi:transcription elongation GreA/GreB family factor
LGFIEDANALIDGKKFDDVESLWMAGIEDDASDVNAFLEVAKSLRKAEQRSMSDTLVGLLADQLLEKKQWSARLTVLKEIARMSRNPQNYRLPIEEALTNSLSGRKSFRRVFEFLKFNETGSNPVEKADRIENWLQFDEGEVFFMAGRGAGMVTELNPELGICRLDFEKEKRVSVPLGAAQKFLTPLGQGHILRERFTEPEKLRTEALKAQAATFARLLQSFGRPMTMGEVRDAMTGVVPDEKWSSWWTAARKNPQIVVSGTGARATYSWNASSGEAANAVRRDFDRADQRSKLDLARKHSGRSQDLADYFSTTLAAEAEKLARVDAALAWQILTTLQSLPGRYTTTLDPDSLLSSPAAARILSSIGDKAMRERALTVVREKHSEWARIYSEAFFLEEEPRLLSLIVGTLEDAGQTDVRDRLIDETLRYPRRHPRAFYWYTRRLNDDGTTDKLSYNTVFQILDGISSDEFAPVRPRLKDFFDKGGLVIRTIMKIDSEESARKLYEVIDRYGAVEDYRRDNVKAAVLMKYPTLREPQTEPLYGTAESLAAKRQELEHLMKVDIPANSKAIQVAREMGDLTENFEYKSARQRAEYLSARAGELSNEISRVRVLDPAQVDTSVVRVGTKVELSNGDVKRDVIILGPWESAPEKGVYSNQSDVAKALIGHSAGEIVSFMGNDYLIESIRKWMD